jgi:hypothetical protein
MSVAHEHGREEVAELVARRTELIMLIGPLPNADNRNTTLGKELEEINAKLSSLGYSD